MTPFQEMVLGWILIAVLSLVFIVAVIMAVLLIITAIGERRQNRRWGL